MSLTERDLDLIEVALESALSATGSSIAYATHRGTRRGHVEDDPMTRLNVEYKHALAGARKMRKAKPLVLTEKERDELHSLLAMVLTNGDQWAMMDLRALRRVAGKVEGQ